MSPLLSRRLPALALTFFGFVSVGRLAAADAVTDWNALTVQFTNAANRAAPTFIFDPVMVHVAIHDAVQAYQHRFETYNAPIPNASGSIDAAIAAAAQTVLLNRFPTQSAAINLAYTNFLSSHGLATNDPGVAVGQQAAQNIIQRRANDGSFPENPEVFTGSTEAGQWRPTQPTFAVPMASPWAGSVTPYVLRDTEELLHEPPPPQLTSGAYTKAYEEVKAMGARTGSSRTPAQTTLAVFYSGVFLTITESTVRTVAQAHLVDVGDTARLFAIANMAAADALINAWNNKRTYNFWRPSTAIANGEEDGNPRTIGDPSWLPLFNDPPYPDYTSGANSITGAMMRTLENFFGDEVAPFNVVTTALQNGAAMAPRSYTSFSAVAQDVTDARVYMGIHFRFADTVARRQAYQAADQVFAHALRPLD
jgi:hypothetical protein